MFEHGNYLQLVLSFNHGEGKTKDLYDVTHILNVKLVKFIIVE